MKFARNQHDGTHQSVEQLLYGIAPDEREKATVEVSQEQYDVLMQHRRSDIVFGTFMGAKMIINQGE